MRTILFILLSLSLTSSAIGQDYIAASVKSASLKSTIHTEYTDLLFFATSTDYNSWYNYAFLPDTDRRAQYCREDQTIVAKVDDRKGLVILKSFDLQRMPEFAGHPSMKSLAEKYNVDHDVFRLTNLKDINPNEAPNRADLAFIVSFDNYYSWINNAFNTDSKRRALFADEAKTQVIKVNDQQAVVLLYEFDMTRMGEFISDDTMNSLIQKYNVTHEAFLMKGI